VLNVCVKIKVLIYDIFAFTLHIRDFYIYGLFGNVVEVIFLKILIFLFKMKIFLYFHVVLMCWCQK